MNRSIFLLLLLIIACGPNESQKPVAPAQTPTAKATAPLPTAESAKALIDSSPEFSDFQFTYASWSVPLQKAALNPATTKTVEELRAAGWLRVGDDIELTERARADKRFLVRPNRTLDIVPLAKKELLGVSSIRASGADAVAEFDWKWIPNEVGQALKSGLIRQQFDALHHAQATLMLVDGAWSVQIIEEK